MRLSFTGKLRFIIIIIFAISLVQGLIVLHLVRVSQDMPQLQLDIQNVVSIALFMQFLVIITLVFYIPIFLRKSFSEIHVILKDISQGIYNLEIDLNLLEKKVDKEIFAVIDTIAYTLKSIQSFDKLKKDKIVEHHNRIISILNLAENGFLILDNYGNIVYLNDRVTDYFPTIIESISVEETNFPPEVENSIKKYILPILKHKSSQESQQFFIPTLKRHIGLHCSMVRDSYGVVKGTVISITNLELKKKHEKSKEQDD